MMRQVRPPKLCFALLSAFVIFAQPMLAGSAQSVSAASSRAQELTATLTEAKGTVYKRGFIDWNKEAWGDPTPAQRGDLLHEGMQIGTGDRSWAEVKWPSITSRAWANSIYAIAPNQRLVYLVNGEMLVQLDKKRDKKSPYYIWTNLLQARMRGTTVLVQATNMVSRLTVLEGVVDVLNRSDHSLVRITPGVVYEVRSAGEAHERNETALKTGGGFSSASMSMSLEGGSSQPGPLAANTGAQAQAAAGGATSQLASAPASAIGQLTNIVSDARGGVQLFQTTKTVTSILVGSVEGLLHHPLVTAFDSVLPSLSLVESSLSGVTNGARLGGLTGSPSSTVKSP
ncbi:MAG TPA: FecR domain-containing protein, partial [Candidatus Obscuribacterales bacterium]